MVYHILYTCQGHFYLSFLRCSLFYLGREGKSSLNPPAYGPKQCQNTSIEAQGFSNIEDTRLTHYPIALSARPHLTLQSTPLASEGTEKR